MSDKLLKNLVMVGWQEWVGLSSLNIPYIKVKIDTGAATSSLGVFNIRHFTEKGTKWVRFIVSPLTHSKYFVECATEVIDERIVADSGGHRQVRSVIQSSLNIGGEEWPIQITLADRSTMKYKMLIGREAMNNKIIVDPAREFIQGKHKISTIRSAYEKLL